MTRKLDLDVASWEQLRRAPLLVWLGLSVADSIVDSSLREAAAFEVVIAAARTRHQDDELLVAILDDVASPSGPQRRGIAAVDAKELLRALDGVRQVLEARCTPEEAWQFKRLLLKMGSDIAHAANESMTGSRLTVSQAEERFLAQARRALAPGPRPENA